MGESDQRVLTSSYKISSGNVMYSMVTTVSNTLYLKVAKRTDLTSSHHKGKKKLTLCEMHQNLLQVLSRKGVRSS